MRIRHLRRGCNTMIRCAFAVILGWAASVAEAEDRPPSPPVANVSDGILIDRSGYVRCFYRFGKMRIDGQALRGEGAELFGAEPGRLEQAFRRYFRGQKVDWSANAWMDQVEVYFFRGQLGDDSKVMELMPDAPAPTGWADPDFEDASWQRRRLGIRKPMRTYQENFRDSSDAIVRDVCYRTYLEVSDPARAGDLRLTCVYRGGIRVLVNGKELARANLPAGQLAVDARGTPYPREAYLLAAGEAPTNRLGHAGDIRCAFDDAPAYRDSKEYKTTITNQPVARAGWDRLRALRDRRLENVKVPAAMLRPGRNVLAIEVRGSDMHPIVLPGAGGPKAENWANAFNPVWQHALLVDLELRTDRSEAMPSSVTWPAGPQVWAQDMHTRLFDNDCRPAGWPMGRVRLVGAPNGTFSAQIGLASGSTALTGLKVTPSALKPATSTAQVIPASVWTTSYLVGHPLTELWKLGYCRSLPGLGEWGVDCPMAWQAIFRQLSDPAASGKGLAGLEFFDHISPLAPASVSARRCQPIWLSLRLPETVAAGTYTGSVRVEADGMAAVEVPVELEVFGWRIPSPKQFQTVVQSEQNPYGIAKAFNGRQQAAGNGQQPPAETGGLPVRKPMALWSNEHFRLIDLSFAQLARLGADWVYVPVLLDSEFGNRADSPVRWVRRKDGRLDFDWTALDRYLDIAVKHLGVPRVICFNIMHGAEAPAGEVMVLDEATGKSERMDLGPKVRPEVRQPAWRAFAGALMAHMREKGLDRSVFWGQAFDNVYDWELIKLMREVAPGTHWAAAGHGRRPDSDFRAVARAYASDVLDVSQQGWKQPVVHLLMPRTAGSIICVEGTSTPFTYRVLCDRAIYCGFNGIGRMGADYFDLSFYDGCRAGEYQLVGRSCIQTLWPGRPDAGAGQGTIDSSARNEAMLEGIQEAEARIYLEQLLDRGLLKGDLAKQTQQVLDDHVRATLYIPTSGPATDLMEVAGDWQARSRRLYQAAALAAAAVPLDVDRVTIGQRAAKTVYLGKEHTDATVTLTVPAGGRTTLAIRLRNWTGSPRAWRAAADQKWIVPAAAEGKLSGHEDLLVRLDGRGLAPGATISGTLTVSDPAAGVEIPVTISATVEKGLELRLPARAMNVQGDKGDGLECLLFNRTAEARPWAFKSSSAAVTCEPASGRIEPGAIVPVKLTARGGAKSPSAETVVLAINAGDSSDQAELMLFVMPAYAEPAVPAGEAVSLEKLPKDAVVRHFSRGGPLKWALDDTRGPLFSGGALKNAKVDIGGKTFAGAMWLVPHGETVYQLDGSFKAFVAEVGVNAASKTSQYHVPGLRVCFDVYADGVLRATSGLMGDSDGPRRIVADGLEQAKQLKLVTRMERLGDSPMNNSYPGYLGYICNWAEPRLVKR